MVSVAPVRLRNTEASVKAQVKGRVTSLRTVKGSLLAYCRRQVGISRHFGFS